jgi:hypothetical protein
LTNGSRKARCRFNIWTVVINLNLLFLTFYCSHYCQEEVLLRIKFADKINSLSPKNEKWSRKRRHRRRDSEQGCQIGRIFALWAIVLHRACFYENILKAFIVLKYTRWQCILSYDNSTAMYKFLFILFSNPGSSVL